MSVRKQPKVYAAKYMGDDTLSWAVFVRGIRTPVVTGLSKREAEAEKVKVAAMLEERANRLLGERQF